MIGQLPNKTNGLLIRKAYLDISERVLKENDTSFIVTGNPGIGKSFFGIYLIHLLLKKNESFYYQMMENIVFFYNSSKNTNSNSEILLDTMKQDALFFTQARYRYIVDGMVPIVNHSHQMILLCSSRKKYFDHIKEDREFLVSEIFFVKLNDNVSANVKINH